jgi:Fe2+ or Zn2+ uptake regulation protein
MSSDLSRGAAAERLTRNYGSILAAIRDAPEGLHLTAQDVFARTRARQPKIGFATVHRGLARLSALGYVAKVEIPGSASAVYEQVATPHAHFRCAHCSAIADVVFAVPLELRAALAQRYGVQIAAESTTFTGRCADCADAAV